MRRHDDVRMRPERAIGRQRFGRKHIEAGAGERAVIDRGEDVVGDLQTAAAGIDQVGATRRAVALELAEQREIENAVGRGRVRQQRDQNFSAGEKCVEAVVAVKGRDAGIARSVRLQPAT